MGDILARRVKLFILSWIPIAGYQPWSQVRSQENLQYRGSVHYICIQHTFLLEVMRHGILCQERGLDLNVGADPFAL